MPMSTCSVHFTSAHLRSPDMLPQPLSEPQFDFSQIPGFSRDIFQSSRLNKSLVPSPSPSPFSPWSDNTDALKIRDSNQQNAFNSSSMMHKHNEIAVKLEDTSKPNPPNNKNTTPTWSQIAAGDSYANNNRLVVSTPATITTNTNEEKLPMINPECSVSASLLLKEEMDIDIQEPSTSGPVENTTISSVAARESRFITDSLAFISSGVNNDQNISVVRPYTVLKIKNVFFLSFFNKINTNILHPIYRFHGMLVHLIFMIHFHTIKS